MKPDFTPLQDIGLIPETPAGMKPLNDKQSSRVRVYVAGPYSSAPAANTVKAMEAADQLIDFGYAVFVPHLSHFQHQRRERSYQEWIDHGLAMIPGCHCLLRLPGESPGADIEVDHAHELGLAVFHSFEKLHAAYTGK